jgi:hypothetical protein
MRQPSSHRLLGYLGSGILLLAALLAGCSATSTTGTNSAPLTGSHTAGASPTVVRTSTPAGGSSNTSQLFCVLMTTVIPIDTVREGLHCTVAHVAGSETAFVLRFTATNNAGPYTYLPFPACQGTLSDGSGSCSTGFTAVAPFKFAQGTVAGATIPHQYPLGPVVPIQVAPTPFGSPVPFITPSPPA